MDCKNKLLNADNIKKPWPKWELCSALGFPTIVKKNLCQSYWKEQETVTLQELFELVISSEKDRRPGYLITKMLDMRRIGITSYFKVIKSMTQADFGGKCNSIWEVKQDRFMAAKRVRGYRYSYSKPIIRDLCGKKREGVMMQGKDKMTVESNKSDLPLIYHKDFYEWPKQWAGFNEDVDVGRRILQEFIPFIEHLVDKKLARSTIKKYMADLGVLGSEIIRSIHDNEEQRNWPARKILLDYIDDEGGPLPHHWDPNDLTQYRYMAAYDSVCRIFYKFLNS